MEVMFDFFISDSPKITKLITLFCASISILTWLNIVSPLYLYINYELIFKKFEIWRIFTSFFFFGKLSTSSLFHIIIFFRNSKLLEKTVFKGNSADYLYFLLFSMSFIFIFSSFFNIIFLSQSLNFALTYYWGRKCKNTMVLVMGILNFRAAFLPIFYLIFNVIVENEYKNSIIGLLAGHIFFYLKDIFPRIKRGKKMQLLKTPNSIKKFCEVCKLNNDFIFDVDEADLLF
jgi:Derlin-2/3